MRILRMLECFSTSCSNYMGVSKNRGTPKWMVKIMENPIKMDDLGVPLFLETPIYHLKKLITEHLPEFFGLNRTFFPHLATTFLSTNLGHSRTCFSKSQWCSQKSLSGIFAW